MVSSGDLRGLPLRLGVSFAMYRVGFSDAKIVKIPYNPQTTSAIRSMALERCTAEHRIPLHGFGYRLIPLVQTALLSACALRESL